MQIQELPMDEFMGRFGMTLFQRAQEKLDPEYLPGNHPALEQRLDALPILRQPFPDQRHAILSAFNHLEVFNEKMVNLNCDMGTGKTLMGQIIPALSDKPRRVIIVCPPHLVQKWAREIRSTLPQAEVFTINHSGANQILARHAAENPGSPKVLTFYVIGRVRLRMSFLRKPVVWRRRNSASKYASSSLCCPECGKKLLRKLSAREVKEANKNGLRYYMHFAVSSEAMEELTEDEDGDISGAACYTEIDYDHLQKPRYQTCTNVLVNGVAATGCGATLWQASRAHPKTPQEQILASLRSLPRVGSGKAVEIAGLPNALEVLRSLEDGIIHPDLARILGPKAKKMVQEFLDTQGFTFADGDYAPVDFIQRRLPKYWFDYAILDELHELKGDDSLAGIAFGRLAGCVGKVIGLTGTLVDGYAQSLHPLLFRAFPQRMLEMGFDAHSAARFQREMGVVKEVVVEDVDAETVSGRGAKVVKRQTRNLPGLHPAVVTHLLLPNTVFLNLPDVERGLQELARQQGKEVNLLPSCREVFVRVPMDPLQHDLVTEYSETLMKQLKDHLKEGRHFVLAPIISALLHYPDSGFRPFTVLSARLPDPIANLPSFGEEVVHAKERFLRDLALREHSQGRKLLLYTTYTDKIDLTGRYAAILQEAGLRVRVLKSNVPTDSREQWVQDALKKGLDVLICNPELVKTGLDLFDFQTIAFAQTGYRTDTVQQASRRSWRIGQTQPVRVYYLGYDESAQIRALSLIAKKMVVSNQAQGSIAKIGLSEAIEDDENESGMMAFANAILDQVRDKSRDALTGSITSLEQDDLSGEFRASPISELKEIMLASRKDVVSVPIETIAPVVKVEKPKARPSQPRPDSTEVLLDDLLADFFSENAGTNESAKATASATKRKPRRAQTVDSRQIQLF